MIKICYIGRSKQVGGAELGLVDIIKKIDLNLFSPFIILPHKDSQNYKMIQNELPNIPLIHVPFEEHLPVCLSAMEQFPLIDPIGIYQLKSAIRKIRPHIVHSNDMRAGKYGSKAAQSLKIPNIVTMRCIYYKRKFNHQRIVEKQLTKNATKIVFNSVRGAELMKERTNSQNIITILNGINLDKFSHSSEVVSIRQKYQIPENRKIILIPARICAEKGQHVVVKIIPELIKQNKDVHFIFLGDSHYGKDDYLQSLKDFSSQNKIEEYITWSNFSFDVGQYYHSSFAVLLPSFLEGTPRILLEALSCAIPIIGSSIDGINEIIQNGHNGFKFDLNNPQTLIDAILKLLSYTDRQYTQLKQNCRLFAEDNYDIKRMIHSYQQLYIEIVNQKNSI